MRTSIVVLALTVACLVFAVPATAALEEICLRDGGNGLAKILGTSSDSITIEFKKKETTVSLKLPAHRLDPHCFYEIRRRNMEETAENHLNLAIYCAKNGMYKRGMFQLSVAEALDLEYVEKMRKTPGLRAGVAKDVLASAKSALDKGDLNLAEEIAVIVTARFHDLPAAAEARDLQGRIRLLRRGAEEASAEKARSERDEAAQKEAEKAQKALEPAQKARDRADEIYSQAVSVENPQKSKQGYDAAASLYIKALRICEKAGEKHEHADVGKLADAIRNDAVRSLVNAGRVELGRGSHSEAGKYADRALKLDPESGQAKALKGQIETADMMNDTFDARYRRGIRGGRRR